MTSNLNALSRINADRAMTKADTKGLPEEVWGEMLAPGCIKDQINNFKHIEKKEVNPAIEQLKSDGKRLFDEIVEISTNIRNLEESVKVSSRKIRESSNLVSQVVGKFSSQDIEKFERIANAVERVASALNTIESMTKSGSLDVLSKMVGSLK